MLAGHLLPSVNNSPVFVADLYNMFMDSKDTGRPSQGLSMIDMPGRMSSLDHMLDASPSHMLNDARCGLPSFESNHLSGPLSTSQPRHEVHQGAAAKLPPASAESSPSGRFLRGAVQEYLGSVNTCRALSMQARDM